jgi:LysR family nitrogen assimilation transcriptional regulator
MLEWLHAGRIDAAVLYGDPHVSTIAAEPVVEEDLCVIAPGAGAERPDGAVIRFADLAGRPLILSTPHHALRKLVDAHAAQAGMAPQIDFEFDSLYATIDAVIQGMGWTILPAATVRTEVARGLLVAWPIIEPALTRILVIATSAQRADALTPGQLGDLLRERMLAIAPLAGWRPLSQMGQRRVEPDHIGVFRREIE